MKTYIHNHHIDPRKYPLGGNIYAEWKAVWSEEDEDLSSLVIKDHSPNIPNCTVSSSKQYKKEGGRQRFVSVMEAQTAWNQKMVVGCFRVFKKVSPFGSTVNLLTAVKILKVIREKNLAEQYPDEFKFVSDHAMNVLVQVPYREII